uniref:BED-type domain-containing protein n=1 Tax=Oryza glaberrima TaxID=4538 RepID=I1PMA2_ORYGL
MDDPSGPSFTLGDFDPNYLSGSYENDATGSAPTPPILDEVPVASDGSGTVSGSASTNTGSKRSRTSGVWQHFDEVAVIGPDGKQVTYAKCRICKHNLSAKSTGGTGHLRRHVESCAKKQGIQLRQQQLLLNPYGTVRTWEYDPMVAQKSLARLIARQDLPLNFGESPAFENYIKTAHNPRFQAVSRQTTTRDLKNVYDEGSQSLKELFSTCTFSVSMTSDIWSGKAKEDYVSVVVHFINDDWQMQKRVLGLRLIDVSHTGENIAERIREVVNEYHLADKIFAVTLDNASANSKAMEILQPLFCVYAESFLLHQRCACHIINLIVKSGFKRVNVHIDAVRQAITWLTSSNPWIAQWKRYCVASEELPRKFITDAEHRWNATYLMLKNVLPYKDLLTVFLQTRNVLTRDGQPLLTDHTWYVVERFFQFLETFHDCTILSSQVYHPTANLILHNILEIATLLKEYENDELLGSAVFSMKQKYLKYWKNLPMLYAFAFILDPRGKLRGLLNLLSLIGETINVDYSNYYSDVKTKLYEVFRKYELKFQGVRLQRPPPAPTAGKKKLQWSRIWGGSSSSNNGGGGSSSAPSVDAGAVGELSNYLDSDAIRHESSDFNVLAWWNDHKMSYPMLSKLARDVLTVPVSTVSSESAFSLTGRIIEDRRTCLSSDHVEMLLSVKDWELAAEHAQYTADNQELVAQFENLYLDQEEPE